MGVKISYLGLLGWNIKKLFPYFKSAPSIYRVRFVQRFRRPLFLKIWVGSFFKVFHLQEFTKKPDVLAAFSAVKDCIDTIYYYVSKHNIYLCEKRTYTENMKSHIKTNLTRLKNKNIDE